MLCRNGGSFEAEFTLVKPELLGMCKVTNLYWEEEKKNWNINEINTRLRDCEQQWKKLS